MTSEQEAYNALCGYTLGRGGADFIHQHVVDAFAAQHADEQTKPIGLTFALVGLYLLVEWRWNGRQVQRAHMTLAKRRRTWLTLTLPRERGAMTAVDVIRAAEGPERDQAIRAWCSAVWAAFAHNRQAIVDLLREHDILDGSTDPRPRGNGASG